MKPAETCEEEFSSLFDKAKEMGKKAGEEMRLQCTCGRQTLQNSMASKTPAAYFRRTAFLPFLANLLQQLTNHFDGVSEAAPHGLLLIPANIHKFDEASQQWVLFTILL